MPLLVLRNYCLANFVLQCCLYLPEYFIQSLYLPWAIQFIVTFSSWKSLSLRGKKKSRIEEYCFLFHSQVLLQEEGFIFFMIFTLESIFPFCVRTSMRNMKGNHVWERACDFRTSVCEPKGNLGLREHSERVSGCASVWRLHRGGQGGDLNDGGFLCGESSMGLTSAGGGWSTVISLLYL